MANLYVSLLEGPSDVMKAAEALMAVPPEGTEGAPLSPVEGPYDPDEGPLFSFRLPPAAS